MDFQKVKDSGERREFSTGAVRDMRVGKGRFDLIPPFSLKRLARHYENGAIKYGDWNWSKGMNQSSFMDSAIRHLNDYRTGDRSEDHLAACAFNVFALIHQEEMFERKKLPETLNDLPTFI